ncbi:hypothetical protein KL86DPRO_20626 [uncultured delta proteobacterium]|uniref:Uncharacterized protein n=1 Tax=uncultured delta proteobacterium TaxID=34034 RepID=A0A212K3E8_9DELT|nr:hypothetical protein KL86DPRO_20626 [uncultured delta proteobacterium]
MFEPCTRDSVFCQYALEKYSSGTIYPAPYPPLVSWYIYIFIYINIIVLNAVQRLLCRRHVIISILI